MMTVHEVAETAGISRRTLRYYDQLGLLPPAGESEAGYRLYDEAALRRLQRILFLRELDFPLREIAPMLTMEEQDRKTAVLRHRELLRLKTERLQRLIDLCDRILKGEDEMSLNEFNPSTWENKRDEYAREAKERWGQTDAWKESEKKTAAYGKEDWKTVNAESEAILREFAGLTGQSPTSPEVRAVLRKWQDHITARYYHCTDEILAGLGQMYVADERFRKNMNAFGEGTAELVSEAIRRRDE